MNEISLSNLHLLSNSNINELKKSLYTDFPLFCRILFKVHYRTDYILDPHIILLQEVIMDIIKEEVINLVINIRPRTGKTELFSVLFPAYAFFLCPRMKFLMISSNERLGTKNSATLREIVKSPLFARISNLEISKNTREKVNWSVTYKGDNTELGNVTFAGLMGKQYTGLGAGIDSNQFSGAIIIDDPNPPSIYSSIANLTTTNNILSNAINTRRNKPNTPMICIQQRLSDTDASGYLLKGKIPTTSPWYHLKIPSIVNKDFPDTLERSNWRDAIKDNFHKYFAENQVNGEASICERKAPLKILKQTRISNPQVFYSQDMQDPQSSVGGIIDISKFVEYNQNNWTCNGEDVQPINYIMIIDTAIKKGAHNDDTAIMVLGTNINQDLCLMIDGDFGKWDAMEQMDKIYQMYNKYEEMTCAYIEETGQGNLIHQLITERGGINLDFVRPTVGGYSKRMVSKEIRVKDIIGYINTNKVLIPNKEQLNHKTNIEWIPWLEEQCKKFDGSGKFHDDMVDVMTYGIQKLLKEGLKYSHPVYSFYGP